ncbi:101 kDa malaria antigen [Eurytemora carolleeae]|uniref:101 kDa malaria antigen n=1 Tax=Eurytemora carolleeae TaxID=1294199 RepID=UPI000C763C67|nr:101 kDa malaria antigen [Eurytemora carolleeae]|eukprot:XP_023326210.1 101 kDa malaria antigen-like [Eurytemora affinis]
MANTKQFINNLFVDYYNTAFQYGDTLYTGLKNSELVLNGNKYTGDDLIVKSKSVIDTAKQGNSSLLGWVVETRNSGEATWNDILKSAEELMKKLQGNPAMQFTVNSLQQIITMLAQLRENMMTEENNEKLNSYRAQISELCEILLKFVNCHKKEEEEKEEKEKEEKEKDEKEKEMKKKEGKENNTELSTSGPVNERVAPPKKTNFKPPQQNPAKPRQD